MVVAPAPQALSVSALYLERLPQLSFMARQDSSYLHNSQAGLVAEIRINLSIYEKPAGEGVCSVKEHINYFLSSTIETLMQPELKSPCKKTCKETQSVF